MPSKCLMNKHEQSWGGNCMGVGWEEARFVCMYLEGGYRGQWGSLSSQQGCISFNWSTCGTITSFTQTRYWWQKKTALSLPLLARGADEEMDSTLLLVWELSALPPWAAATTETTTSQVAKGAGTQGKYSYDQFRKIRLIRYRHTLCPQNEFTSQDISIESAGTLSVSQCQMIDSSIYVQLCQWP